MSKRFTLLLALLAVCALSGCGGNNEAEIDTESSWSGGAALSVESPTKLAELVSDPDPFVGKTLRLEGKISGVCKGSGCWVELTDEAGHTFIAKSIDHSISFPRDCEGKRAVVQGTIISQPAPEEAEAHAHAEEEGEVHECPAPTYMMDMKGAELI